MNGAGLFERQVAGILLILCFLLFCPGGILFSGRAFLGWRMAQSPGYLRWERSFVIAAVLATLLGLVLLEDLLRAAGDPILGRLGALLYGFGAVVVAVAETLFLDNQEWPSSPVMLYVVLAFLAQAVIGVSLVQTGLVPGWVGWATVVWNLGWLVVLFGFSQRDRYFPVLHHAAPLLIGVALLAMP